MSAKSNHEQIKDTDCNAENAICNAENAICNDENIESHDEHSKIEALLILVESLLKHINNKKPCIALMLLLASCGNNLSPPQSKANSISCDVLRDLKERGISQSLTYTELQEIQARVYSNAYKELSGQTGEAVKLNPPLPCVL